ncbi:ATP-binding protein [Paenibacillus chitinolyticus]|uniref:ATP-binding protein n=1 Tax=Paenibacillus chitinolyticus TaxID=79263 RepID=UPI002DBB7E71|nr:ATP-binding protein [Paenibacillus chitinolyticus]MEC0246681.1 ATP-binding protein [Paenibacillus chitinolyticus]
MIYKWFVIFYASVISISSWKLGLSVSGWLPLSLLFLAAAVLGLKRSSVTFSAVKLVLLTLFHWSSQTDWCFTLYLLLLASEVYESKSRKTVWMLVTLNLITFTVMALITAPAFSVYPPLWMILLYLSNFAIFMGLALTVFNTFRQRDKLAGERRQLMTHDSLTGLPNFEACHAMLHNLVDKESRLLFILIDCTDLKAMNKTQGFQAGNQILKQIAVLLKIKFSQAAFISRYGGDEFAVAVTYEDKATMRAYVDQQLGSELPKLTGIQITYGIAVLPDDGSSKDDLVLIAENSLFSMKREMWLKREEHMLRSEKLRIVGELASGMAHEIRNPLTTIKGFLQISKSNGYNIETWYPLIMDEISRMSELTAEFLQFSKPHAVHFRVVSMQLCIQRVISLTLSEMSRLGHEIVYNPPDKPMNIWMDADKMVQLLINLFKNAYESMEDNKKMAIRLYERDHHAVLEIEDQGSGIPVEQLDQIFNPFFTTKDSGTGLGLSICHKIVQDHNGTIEVESFIGRGTTFIMTFPLAEPESTPCYPLNRRKNAV